MRCLFLCLCWGTCVLYVSALIDFDCICVSAGEQPRNCGQRTLSSWFLTACGQFAVVRERFLLRGLVALSRHPRKGLLRHAAALAKSLDCN